MSLAQSSAPFLDFLENWQSSLPTLPLAQAFPEPSRTAIIAIDVISGFCHEGPLASARVAGIVAPIVKLFQQAWQAGVRHIVLPQDTHDPEAVEFAQWPAHCVRGSVEANAVPEIQALPFYDQMVILPKNSINPALNTGLTAWSDAHPKLDTFVIAGDCTDLCTYQLAMHIRLEANAFQKRCRVILPANCVDTFDLPLEVARQVSAQPHPADLIHVIFLYHMALNGIEVVKNIL
jgi:nicotinamidase-related amidase